METGDCSQGHGRGRPGWIFRVLAGKPFWHFTVRSFTLSFVTAVLGQGHRIHISCYLRFHPKKILLNLKMNFQSSSRLRFKNKNNLGTSNETARERHSGGAQGADGAPVEPHSLASRASGSWAAFHLQRVAVVISSEERGSWAGSSLPRVSLPISQSWLCGLWELKVNLEWALHWSLCHKIHTKVLSHPTGCKQPWWTPMMRLSFLIVT